MQVTVANKRRIEATGVVFFACLSLILFFISSLMYFSGVLSKTSLFLRLIPCVVAVVMLGMLIYGFKDKPEVVFLLLAIPMGVALALFILPDQVPDERWHIFRAIDLRFFGGGTTVPDIIGSMPSNYSEYMQRLVSPDAWSSTVWFERDLTSYLPHLYMFAHAVFVIFRALNINPYIGIIVARVVNGAIFVVVGYFCVKNIPHAKVMLAVFLLNPMLLQQEFSISADSVVNTSAIAFTTYLFWMKFDCHLARRDFVCLGLLAILTSISKYAYAPLVLLTLLLVPYLPNKKHRVCIRGGVAALIVLGGLFVIVAYKQGTYLTAVELVRNPKEFCSVMLKSVYELGPNWIKQTFGMSLGALNVVVWEPCFWLYCGVLLSTAVFNLGEDHAFSRLEKVFLAGFTAALFAVILLVFRDWTLTVDKRSDVIMGFQGRYFLPFIFPALSALATPRACLKRPNCMVLYSGCLGVVYVFALYGIVRTFAG